jgi:tRNA(fMet)-specific endonuclease VapC
VIVLDTDHLTVVQWGQGPDAVALRARLAQLPREELLTTIITFEEESRGWLAHVGRARSAAQLVKSYGYLLRHLELFKEIPVLPFDQQAASEYQRLRGMRIRIGSMDLRIAAIVLTRSATLLSRNLVHFRQIPGLTVEDWTP